MKNRALDIFGRAYEMEAEEREAFLSEECGNDAELRREVEQLLSDASRTNSFYSTFAALVLRRLSHEPQQVAEILRNVLTQK